MLKKELRDTLRVVLESTLLLTAIPFILFVTWITGLDIPSAELIHGMAMVTVVAFAGYSGMTLFQAEKRDRGFEYMLTLPVSKLKILLYKYIPRLLVLILFIVALDSFSGVSFKQMFLPLVVVQAGMVCLSLAFQTYFSGFVAFILLGFFYNLSSKFSFFALYHLGDKNYTLMNYFKPEIAAIFLMGIPLAISFLLVFRNYDLKPRKYAIKPYYYIALPVFIVEFVVFFSYFSSYSYMY